MEARIHVIWDVTVSLAPRGAVRAPKAELASQLPDHVPLPWAILPFDLTHGVHCLRMLHQSCIEEAIFFKWQSHWQFYGS